MQEFDFVVIGGGSAGLKAARTAAKLGRKVALAEERELGGECFWGGCVPTKAMVRAADVWHSVRHTRQYGIEVEITKADFAQAMQYKRDVIKAVGGEGPSDGGLAKLGAAYFPTRATFESPHEVRVGGEVIYGKNILIATGTVPAIPPIPGLAEVGYITNREAVTIETLPKRLVILGGGADRTGSSRRFSGGSARKSPCWIMGRRSYPKKIKTLRNWRHVFCAKRASKFSRGRGRRKFRGAAGRSTCISRTTAKSKKLTATKFWLL